MVSRSNFRDDDSNDDIESSVEGNPKTPLFFFDWLREAQRGSERLREENAGDQIVISVARVLLTMTGQSKVKPM